MYEQRFGLNRKPFQSILTNVDFYESSAYKDLSESVLHALRSDLGVAVLTGPSGIGKTVTLDAFRRSLDRDGQAMVLRGGTIQTASDLLHSLHRRLIPPPGNQSTKRETAISQNLERWEVLERMQRIADFWGPTIILLDDAHLAGTEVFAELRTLMEEEADGHRLVRLLIAGPISLEETLAEPAMSDFAQRIRAHEFLQPFTSTESVAYLEHQIARVGGETKKIFEATAIERIVAAADGVPRCIDLLADESLMGANKAKVSVVALKHVDEALGRLRHLPHSWNVSLFSSDEEEPDIAETETASGVSKAASVVQTQPSSSASFVVDAVQTKTSATGLQSRAPAGVASKASGVIEIGGPETTATGGSQSRQQPPLANQTATKPATEIRKPVPQSSGRIPLTSPGVIEIGADIATASVDRVTVDSPKSEADAASNRPTTSNVVEVGSASDNQRVELASDIGEETTLDKFLDDAVESSIVSEEQPPSPSPPTPAAPPAPRKSVDFDRVFGAVSFAGGAVAVAKEVLSQGKLKPEDSSNASQQVTQPASAEAASDAVSLEHHMVLANSQESNSEADNASEKIADSEQQATVAVLEDLADSVGVSDNSIAAVENYQPWQPAGSWLAPPDAPRRLYQSPGQANSSPVFDRYTWCELGRTVTSPPSKQMKTVATHAEDVVWPPVVDGIAPTTQIPMLAFDEDYTELLSDLGILIESTSSTLSERRQQSPTAANTVEQLGDEPVRQSDSEIEPDQWIDRIDELIDSDSAEVNKPSTEDQSGNDSIATEVTSDSSTPGNSGQRLFTLPIDIHEVDLSPPNPFTPGESQQAGTDSDSGSSHDANSEVEVQLTEESLQVLECGDVIQEGAEGQTQQVYAPRLLAQARSKVATMGTAVGGLKKAAGAESLTDVAEVKCGVPQVGLHISECDETDLPQTQASGGFSNLFTRLRQLRKR